MSADATAKSTADEIEAEFRQRMAIEGDLGLFLCEYVWGQMATLDLGGQEFELAGCEEVPGYEDENEIVLLRRKSDGRVFEANIDVDVHPVRVPDPEPALPLAAEGAQP